MHWTIGTIILVVVVFLAGAYYSKKFPSTIPFVT